MFQVDAKVRASVFVFVMLIPSRYFVFVLILRGNFLAEPSGENVFAAQLNTHGCFSECPRGVGVEVGSIDIRLVKVLIVLWAVAPPNVVVERAVPINLQGHMHLALIFSLCGNEVAPVLFVLRVGACAVESVGSVVHCAESCLQRGIEQLASVFCVPIGLTLVEIIVQGASVAALVASAEAVVEVARLEREVPVGSECTVRAPLEVCAKLAVAFGAGDDVDGSGKCLAAIHSAGTSLNHFDALDVVNAEGKINGQVASVWIGDVDAVEQNGELVLSASVHPYVGLDAESSSLSHIHTCCEFEQVVDGVGAGCLNVLAANDLHQPNGFVGRERCACGCHLGGSKLQFKHGRVLVGLSLRLFVDGCVLSGLLAVTHSHLCCSRFGACNSKSGYAEHPDVDFFFQTEEDGIAVASKVVPHDGFLLLEACFFHHFCLIFYYDYYVPILGFFSEKVVGGEWDVRSHYFCFRFRSASKRRKMNRSRVKPHKDEPP